MQLQVGKHYVTVSGLKARLTYVQPKDVQDAFPFIGHVRSGAEKFGMCWSLDGRNGETSAYDLHKEISEEAYAAP